METEMTLDTSNELATGIEDSHLVIGCGGVGFWLAILLAMSNCKTITLIDYDTISPSNRTRIPVPIQWIGKSKIAALRVIIKILRPTCKVKTHPIQINEENVKPLIEYFGSSNCLIWDCTDHRFIQELIVREIKENEKEKAYLKVAYDKYKIGLYTVKDIDQSSKWSTGDAQERGYRASSANVLTSVCAAALAIINRKNPYGTIDLNFKLLEKNKL